MEYKILIGSQNTDYTRFATIPFSEQYVLDQSLDNGVLALKGTHRNRVFKPFTLVQIIKNGNDTTRYFIAQDTMTEIIGTGTYNHDLTLVEETKILEKKVVDTNTTTQPLAHNYNFNEQIPCLVYSSFNNNFITTYHYYYNDAVKTYYTAIKPSELPSMKTFNAESEAGIEILDNYYYTMKITLQDEDGNIVETESAQQYGSSDLLLSDNTQLSDKNYTLTYELGEIVGGVIITKTIETMQFAVVEKITPRNPKSITDVVNRLLRITDTLRANETPKLVFDSEQAEYYNQAKETWLINDSPDITNDFEAHINFISNGNHYSVISSHDANLYYDNTSMYFEIGDLWRDNVYKTITFLERPKGEFLEWLQANATKQSEELLYPSPEFSMTKSTLRECLDQVGAYIHSIVRLDNGVVKFDKLGGNKHTEATKYVGYFENQDSEQYASQLDSVVDNLTNIDDEAQGTITEPFAKGYETLRADGTIRIGEGENSSVCIETEYPIEKIKSLKIGYIAVNNQEFEVGDITPYVYENAEYQALSSYSGAFPNSKGYAIYYTQGQKNIRGLSFKLPNPISPVFSNQAIYNIISQKLGQSVQNLFQVQNPTELNYQLEYYPSTTARIKQVKQSLKEFDHELASIYNQGANKVDSRYYGENLKGAIARLGNVERSITTFVKNPSEIKRVGELYEDCYISKIAIENNAENIKVTYGLSKDFNALNKYIGIMNNIRMYEVSEKQVAERFVSYDDYCVIGQAIPDGITELGDALITEDAVETMLTEFNGEENTKNAISVVRAKGFDIDNNELQEVDLPVFSLGLGNSIWFGFKYADNYSAGNTSEDATNYQPTSQDYYRVQNYVRYTDQWGELYSLKVQMFDYLTPITDKTTAVQVGNALPKSTITASQDSLIDTMDKNIIIDKDNRECINFGYQLHFIENDKNIVIGSALAQNNPLVTNYTRKRTALYILPHTIDKFANIVDLTNATLVKELNSSDCQVITKHIVFSNQQATENGKSWVLIDADTNKLLFGKNVDIIKNENIEMPVLSFIHKVIV